MQLGEVFFDKTLAQSPSAAPVRFCFMAHGSHRFIVCSVQGSPRGPHRKRCATSRGPPCKQGATIATLHCICRLSGTNSRPPEHHTTSSFHHMRLPLTRNQLPTTSTPPSRFHFVYPHAFAAYAEPAAEPPPTTSTPRLSQHTSTRSFEPSFDAKRQMAPLNHNGR